MALGTRRYTQYDVLEAKGAFTSNPANKNSFDHEGRRLYSGPVAFPRMLYHPQGEERVVVPAEAVATPFGPKWVGEQRELIHKVVNSPAEEAEALLEGWHRTPGEAMVAAGKAAPPANPVSKVRDLEAELAALRAERDELKAKLDE
jgi:hypothetical protein